MNFSRIRDQRRQDFRGKTPDEILGLHNDSFEIPLEQIRSIVLSKGFMGTNLEIEGYRWGQLEKLSARVSKEQINDVNAFLSLCPQSSIVR